MNALLLEFPSVVTRSRADAKKLGYVGRQPLSKSRDSDAWYTPPEYIEFARAVMERIDLDPFSSISANVIVQAKHIFTQEKSAFEHSWNVEKNARVFMNPPYSAGLITHAVNRFIDQWQDKAFSQAVVLVNNATDTRWFNLLIKHSIAMCFTDHRISFWNADGKRVSGNTRGQTFFYFGNTATRFQKKFSRHGFIVKPVD